GLPDRLDRRDGDQDQDDGRDDRPGDFERRVAVSLFRFGPTLTTAELDDREDEQGLHHHEHDRAEQQQPVPEAGDDRVEIGEVGERGVRVLLSTGGDHQRDCDRKQGAGEPTRTLTVHYGVPVVAGRSEYRAESSCKGNHDAGIGGNTTGKAIRLHRAGQQGTLVNQSAIWISTECSFLTLLAAISSAVRIWATCSRSVRKRTTSLPPRPAERIIAENISAIMPNWPLSWPCSVPALRLICCGRMPTPPVVFASNAIRSTMPWIAWSDICASSSVFIFSAPAPSNLVAAIGFPGRVPYPASLLLKLPCRAPMRSFSPTYRSRLPVSIYRTSPCRPSSVRRRGVPYSTSPSSSARPRAESARTCGRRRRTSRPVPACDRCS